MNETIFLNLNIHNFFNILFGILLLVQLGFSLVANTANFSYLKRLMLILPALSGALAACIISGITALAFLHFNVNLQIFAMILASFAFIFCEVKTSKWIKKVRILRNFKEFKIFMCKKIFFELIILLSIYFWIKL